MASIRALTLRLKQGGHHYAVALRDMTNAFASTTRASREQALQELLTPAREGGKQGHMAYLRQRMVNPTVVASAAYGKEVCTVPGSNPDSQGISLGC